jgi:dihydroneopterin aldolase
MQAKAFRGVELQSIMMPVRVSHGNLEPNQRIDNLSNRIDTLEIRLAVQYESHGEVQPYSMNGAWNYGDVYQKLCLSDVETITGPLEGVLDDVLSLVENTATKQQLSLIDVQATADRMGLAVGYPRLIAKKRYSSTPKHATELERSAGIRDFPLVISVDHSWCKGSQRVEHVDFRTEAVSLSFRADTKASSLSSSDLTGLYNYAGLIHQVQKMHGMVITGPIEQLCDKVAEVLELDARSLGVELLKTVVEVKRTGYARCTPVLSLTKIFI